MGLRINRNYIKNCLLTLIILLDASALLLLKDNKILAFIYFFANIIGITYYCLKVEKEDGAIFSLIFMLLFTYFIDAFIHYFHKIVIFEAEFLFILPLIISVIRTKNKNSKMFAIVSGIYLIANLILTLLLNKVDIVNYLLFMVNIFSFVGFYYVYSNTEFTSKLKHTYIYLFILSVILTLFQSRMGFNEDTRNGIFSVFGWGAYTFFIMIFLIYNLRRFLYKESSIINLGITIGLCGLLYISTESKAALVMMVIISMVLLAISRKKLSQKIIIVVLGIILVPVAYKVLIYFTPKFAHLNSIDQILRYFLDNNNTRYYYGRFEAIKNVFSILDIPTKLFGIGFGGSCPLYRVFFDELGRNQLFPYYTQIYGYKYGYQHTSTAILLLDGGITLFLMVIGFIITKAVQTVKGIIKNKNNTIDFIRLGTLIYLLYFFTYSNVLKDFRVMALLGILLGIRSIDFNDEKDDDMLKIVTVYNSLNPGSMLQATALYRVLNKKYNNVKFLVTGSRYPFLSGVKLSYKLMCKMKIKYAIKQFFMPLKYNRILRKYKKTSATDKKDIYVLGSDEIWNVSREKIAKHKVFWGEGLDKSRCLSYAPSMNNTTIEDIKKYNFVKDSLENLHSISIRDSHSKKILESVTDRKIELVCDPTMLLDPVDYKELELPKLRDNYIFVYGSPKRFTDEMIKEIKRVARISKKKLISYYFYNDWCDEILYGSPYEFLSLIDHADYVFTNTFHGTIFSIIYNKQFVAFGNDNKKVDEILSQFKLDNNYSYNKDIDKILKSNFNYDKINKDIQKIRKKSLDYLYNNIDEIAKK